MQMPAGAAPPSTFDKSASFEADSIEAAASDGFFLPGRLLLELTLVPPVLPPSDRFV